MKQKDTRLQELERSVSPKDETLMVMYMDWLPGKGPPPEQIEVCVSYCGNSRKTPERMTLAEYRRRFPDWEQAEVITVRYDEESEPYAVD